MKQASGLEYKDMLFFDDEDRNIKDLRHVGVVSYLIRHGVDKQEVENGLKEYATVNSTHH